MPGAYIVAESIFIITLVITASAYASTIFSFVDEFKHANQLKLKKIKKEAETSFEPLFGYVAENRSTIFVWLKNIGPSRISHAEIQAFDIFLIGRNVVIHLRYGNHPPCWTYELVRDALPDNGWSWGETILIKISLSSPIDPGEYVVRIAGLYSSTAYVLSVGG